jgi:hypothetical protein
LGIGEVGEDLASQELAAQGLVPALDLAGRGRRTRRGQQMLDALLSADAVKAHRSRSGVRVHLHLLLGVRLDV